MPLFTPGRKSVIGMLHAPPLPGSPGYGGDFGAVCRSVLVDAEAWVEGGLRSFADSEPLAAGLMLENFGDVPFFRGRVPAEVVACLTRLGSEVRAATGLPLGINVLRNDGESALAVAAACGAQYVRVNVLSGAVVTDQGVIEGDAARLMRRKQEMGAEGVQVFGDIRVKHAAPLGGSAGPLHAADASGWRPIDDEVEELVLRAGAGGVIVSGTGTGKATDLNELREVRRVMDRLGERAVPIFVGSGASAETAPQLLASADGLIVGTSVKQGGQLGRPVDPGRVAALLEAVRGGG